MESNYVLQVDGVYKKHCRSLKRAMWYGLQDVWSEVRAGTGPKEELRKEEFWALRQVSLTLSAGECLGLIGPNGAGKSTLLKLINGLIKPDIGRLVIRGRVSALIELGAGFSPVLTTRENVFVNGSILGMTKAEIAHRFDEIIDFAELNDFVDTPTMNLSSGMKVRLGFSIAAQLAPDLLLIDEVLAVGDVHFRMKCFKKILDLKDSGTAVVFVSHNTTDIGRVCDRTLVLDHGGVVADADVPKGIAAYMKACMAPAPAPSSRPALGPVRLLHVEIQCEAGGQAPELATNDELFLRIEISSSLRIELTRVWVGIYQGATGLIASFSTAEYGLEVNLESGTNNLHLQLPQLPLRLGHYTVACGVYGPGIDDVLDFNESAAAFTISRPQPKAFGFGSPGLVSIPHVWRQ